MFGFIDRKVFDIHLKKYIKIDKKRIYLVDAFESIKNIDTVLNICEFMQCIILIKDLIFML